MVLHLENADSQLIRHIQPQLKLTVASIPCPENVFGICGWETARSKWNQNGVPKLTQEFSTEVNLSRNVWTLFKSVMFSFSSRRKCGSRRMLSLWFVFRKNWMEKTERPISSRRPTYSFILLSWKLTVTVCMSSDVCMRARMCVCLIWWISYVCLPFVHKRRMNTNLEFCADVG